MTKVCKFTSVLRAKQKNDFLKDVESTVDMLFRANSLDQGKASQEAASDEEMHTVSYSSSSFKHIKLVAS